MAGTDSRSDDEWPLFNAAVARLSEIFAGSDKTALELILYHLDQRDIGWGVTGLTSTIRAGPGPPRRCGGFYSIA
jgi:hypothetical protein